MLDNKIQKIGVLTLFQFPEGMAPATRIIAYGKGLVRNCVETEVIVFRPLHTSFKQPQEGFVEGIRYVYTHSRSDKISKIRNAICDKPLSIIKTINYIRKSNKKKKYDCILISFDDLLFMALYIFGIRLMNIPLLFIGDEYPIPIREQLRKDIPTWKKIAYKLLHIPLRGRILMTEALMNYYNKIALEKPTHILPTIVDVDRFNGVVKLAIDHAPPFLCYMGNLELAKDNVDNIIRAFSILKRNKEYDCLELHLYGTPSLEDKSVLEKLIEELGLQGSVLFKGRANYSEVPSIISQATILVTSQPRTKRAEGGFPTKIGEYLLSNRPAIVTNVGEISKYITNGVNAYMVEPCDPEDYAKKLQYILSHLEEALEVAKRGRAYIIENFSCEKVSADLLSFLTKRELGIV